MYLKNKKDFVHVKLEAEDIADRVPAGVYDVTYNPRESTTHFNLKEPPLSNFIDLGTRTKDLIEEEVAYFFTQTKQRGILVHGGPGNGKTRMIVEILREHALLNDAVVMIGPDMNYMDQIIGAIRVDEPDRTIIIFFDEFDEVHENYEYDLLRFLDGSSSISRCLTVGALNDLNDLEPRVYKRPGRFGLVTELENPDFNARLKFALAQVTSVELAHRIARATQNLSLDYVREVAERVLTRGHSIESIFNRLALELPEDFHKGG